MPLLFLHRLRRVVMAAGAAAALLAALYSVALAHTRLLSSEPAIDARLTSSPRRIRLVFSEPVEPRLGGITVTGADSVGIRLAASGDPDDVHALIAPVEQPLPAGSYRVHWRAVSADGHPIEGSYAFTIASGPGRGDTAAVPVAAVVAATPPAPVTTEAPLPYGNAALRGLAVGCLMAAGGLLFFVVFPGAPGVSPPRVARAALWLTLAAALFTLLHLMAWARHVASDGSLASGGVAALVWTTVGRMEAARAVLALLALLAIAIVRRPAVALAFAAAALVAGGWTGHSVAVATAFTGPARALHLLGVAVWLGGLLWLFLTLGSERSRAAAARVSSLALAAVLVVAISGLVQLGFFLPEPYAHLDSAYGAVSLAKIAGLGALVAFGAYHQKRVLPRLADAGVESGFRRSLRLEIALMTVVVLVGGVLAYIPPPTGPR